MVAYSLITFAITMILTLTYLFMWHKHAHVLITLLFILAPVTNLAYFLLSTATTLEEAIIANKFSYIGGCYLLLIVLFAIFDLCNIKLKTWMKISLMSLSTIVFLTSLTGPGVGIFNKNYYLEQVGDAYILHREYGFMHYVFYAMVILYFVLSLFAIIYSYLKKHQASRKTIILLFIFEALCLLFFLIGRIFKLNIELTPMAYNLYLFAFILIINRVDIYDIADGAIDSMIENGDTGFISFDFRLNYLGSNETAKTIMPKLNDLIVDKKINQDELKDTLLKWLNDFIKNQHDQFYYDQDDKVYLFTLNYLYDGKKKMGYQFVVKDDTQNQEYIKLINSFNEELQTEVEQKTKDIIRVNNKFVLGLATMVESRDNSTGGHIKRTSEGVRILMNEMMKDNLFDEAFYKNIIKAAPMHDLGKIAVDDAILRKPGKFTPEEFEQMKTHAAEGAKIIHEIVDDSDAEFKLIAENVAHYHHERIDGTGYPNGLKGEEIPIEARIMAIADVYDALVSKRVYKEKFSFEKAYSIIMEGMGSQFDKNLEKYFVNSREKLEEYYTNIEENM